MLYRHTPKPNRRPGIILSAFLFFIAVALFVPFPVDGIILTLLRSIALWMFFIGYVVLERYVFTSYSYIIKANDDIPGQYDFKVISVRYKRRRVVCRISVDCIEDIYKDDRKAPRAKPQRSVKKYNYCPDMVGRNRFWLRLEDEGDAAIRFCPDEEMVKIIKNLINRK